MNSTNASAFHFPATGMTADKSAILLAIDDVSLPLRKNLCLYLSKPEVRREPVLTPSLDPLAPDSLATHFYGTVLHEEGRFRMWYYPCSYKQSMDPLHDNPLQWMNDNMSQGPVCYAESDDGIEWRRPELGQVLFNGTRDNNAIELTELPLEGVTLIRDDDDPNPRRRYKMIYNYLVKEYYTLRTATSADGITWTVGPERPLESFAEQASFYKHNGLYIANTQCTSPWVRSEGGGPRGRQAVAFVSADFDHWLAESVASFTLPEPRDPAERGTAEPYDQVHLGVGAASFGNVAVGFYCLWHNSPNPDDWFGLGTTSGDLVLVVSNDGLTFREPVARHVYLSREDSPVTPVDAAYQTVLCQANGILNVGDETRIYHGRWRNSQEPQHYYAEVALATLPRDRWGALGLFPEEQQGTVWSTPVTLPPEWRLSLNADDARGITVEIADPNFSLLPNFSSANCGTCGEDGGLDCDVHWSSDNCTALSGQTVRFRFTLARSSSAREPRLYAANLFVY